MRTVFLAQLAKDRRNPLVLLLFIGLSIVSTLLFASGGREHYATVLIFSEAADGEAAAKWQRLLNGPVAPFIFKVADAGKAREQVQSGRSEVAVRLMDNDYRVVAAVDTATVQRVEQHVRKVMARDMQIRALAGEGDAERLRAEVDAFSERMPIRTLTAGPGGEPLAGTEMRTRLLIAFTFLFALFTAGFKVNGVTNDKVAGVWNRLLQSPVRRTDIYLGYISYSFCVSFMQIASVLLICKWGLGMEIGDHYGLMFATVAVFCFSITSLAMLFVGLIRKPEQFYSLYPAFVSLIPLISGAYMPAGAVGHPVLAFLADLFPVSHGMDAMLAAIQGRAEDVSLPLALLLLIGVLYIGTGVHLAERRTVL